MFKGASRFVRFPGGVFPKSKHKFIIWSLVKNRNDKKQRKTSPQPRFVQFFCYNMLQFDFYGFIGSVGQPFCHLWLNFIWFIKYGITLEVLGHHIFIVRLIIIQNEPHVCLMVVELTLKPNICYFHLYLRKIPILTNIFQMGWNHQLACFVEQGHDIYCYLGVSKIGVAFRMENPIKLDDLGGKTPLFSETSIYNYIIPFPTFPSIQPFVFVPQGEVHKIYCGAIPPM